MISQKNWAGVMKSSTSTKVWLLDSKKNSAYGSHRISRPMRILSPRFFSAAFDKWAKNFLFIYFSPAKKIPWKRDKHTNKQSQTMYWVLALSGKKFFQKTPPPPAKLLLEDTMKHIYFFGCSKRAKKCEEKYGPSHFKLFFGIDLQPPEVIKLKMPIFCRIGADSAFSV